MNRIATFAAAAALTGAVTAAHAAGLAGIARPPVAPPGPIVAVAGDCRAIGQQIAAQHGGTLADAHVENRGGQQVCVGVVVVPARGGERGRQIPFAVPM